jgi:hypothetical protein
LVARYAKNILAFVVLKLTPKVTMVLAALRVQGEYQGTVKLIPSFAEDWYPLKFRQSWNHQECQEMTTRDQMEQHSFHGQKVKT